jgi:hypothetical protein
VAVALTEPPRRILILGGYGTFGGRLARLLVSEPALTLLIAGRSATAARSFCMALPAGAARSAEVLDRDGDLQARLREIAPDVVVDASGPFQAYGADPYGVVRAALACGAHYLDLADGSEFVRGIARFDDEARRRGLVVLSGASSFPVLTAAAVRHLAHDFARVHAISGGIAPSPHARVGLNVMRAIAGYAGQPIAVTRDGREARARAFVETRRRTVAPPGAMPLAPRVFSLVDVPDLRLLADLRPEVRSVWMGAAPAPAALHRLLRWLARAVSLRLVPSLAPFAALMHRTLRVLHWGEHRGGMFVEVEGERRGERARRSWHLVAEGDDGPFIPSMAVAGILRRWHAGRAPAPGARPALRELELADYDALFARRRIATGCRSDAQTDGLYRRLLGESWSALPIALRSLHAAPQLRARGKATVVRGAGLLARAAARLFCFPAAAEQVDVEVLIERREGSELWTRDFGGRRFSSVQFAGSGRSEWLLCERFGPFVFGMALVVEASRLRYVVRRWTCCGIPLPRALGPSTEASEFEEAGRFRFSVEIASPLTGLIVRYSGFLDPVTDARAGLAQAQAAEPAPA